jgi:biotin carboxylase
VPTVLLILPTGTYRAEEYLAAAKRLGATVVVASEREQALAPQMKDRALALPLDDPERAAALVVEHDSRLGLDAVLAVDDQGLLTAALASEALGLRHNPSSAARLTRDKAAMRRAFGAAEVEQPRYVVVAPGSPEGAARAAAALGRPVVVKPCSLSGSRGVIRADTPDDARRAAERICPILEAAGEAVDSPLLVEEFVAGAEVAVEGILTDGRLDVVAVFDKPDPLEGPFFEETLYVAPARLDEPERAAVERATGAAVAALGLTDGPVHAELRLAAPPTPGGPRRPAVLEVAARTIGGRCSKALRLGGGATLEDLVVARALGLPGPPPRLEGPGGVLMIPIPRSGVLREVRHVEEARALEGITGVEITVPAGRRIQALPEGDRYVGFVFAAAPTPSAVERALRAAGELILVDIDPAVTVVG